MSILDRQHNVTTRYKDICMYMQKSNSSGTCNKHYFLERGDKKLYNLICVGVRIARFKCVWFFANVTDPFNIAIHNTEQSLLRMLERYL